MPESNEKICPACWARNSDDMDVCRACGASLAGGVAGTHMEGPQPAAETQPASPLSPPSGTARADQPPKADNADTETQLLAERYRLVYEIARGGMGIVYLAEDTYLDNLRVAIKLLAASLSPDLQAEKRLKREARTAMQLSHAGIMRLYSFDQHQGQSFLVMEYINGPTLEGLTEQRGRLTPAEVALFMGPTCEALDYAHSQGVVHRDIKPANIMLSLPPDSPFASQKGRRRKKFSTGSSSQTVTLGGSGATATPPEPAPPRAQENDKAKPLSEFTIEDGRSAGVKICDFGIAQQLRQTMTRLTGTSLIGSPVYMSPEQLEGAKVDHHTDIYSLGVSVYEMLTGELPFDGPMHSLTYQIMEKDPPPVKGVDKMLSDVVLKSMAKTPRDRWQTCMEFARALEDAVAGKITQISVPETTYGRRARAMKEGTHLSSDVSTRRTAPERTRLTDRRVADIRVAKLSFEEKLYDKTLEEMKQFRLLHGESDELLTFAAQCVDTLVQRRAFAQAHDFCQFVLLIDEENPNVYLTLGRIQRVLGRTTDAERNLRLAMMYGADENVIEKELRGTLSELREIGEEMGGAVKVLHITPARIGGYVGGELFAVGLSFIIAILLSSPFHGQGRYIASYIVSGVVLAVLAGAANLLLTTVFAGPFDQLSKRSGLVKTYLAGHGYAVGLLGIAALGVLAWLLSSTLFAGRMDDSPAAFALIFGTAMWLGSVLYSWFVVYNALSRKRFSGTQN